MFVKLTLAALLEAKDPAGSGEQARWLPSRPVPHRHRPRAERQPAHELQVDASWKLWLQDLALDSLETSAGIVRGWSSLALLPHVRPQGGL